MLEAIPYWLHLMAAAVWIGSQVMMFAVVMPAVRLIDNQAVRGRVMYTVTRRFGYLGWGALILLVLTGMNNVVDKNDLHQPLGVFDFGVRYAWILSTKIGLAVVVILLTAWHTFIHGPRMLRAQEAAASVGRPSPEAEARLRSMRRLSIIVSAVNLLLVVGIVYLVTLLQNDEFAFTQV